MNHAVTNPSRCLTSSENKPQWRIRNRAISYWVSEVIRNCINFALPHSVIGPEILSHPLNQSYSKPKPVRLVHTRFSAPCSDYSISIDVLIGPLYYLAFWLAEMIGLSTCIGLTLLKFQPIKCQMRFPAFHGGCIFFNVSSHWLFQRFPLFGDWPSWLLLFCSFTTPSKSNISD